VASPWVILGDLGYRGPECATSLAAEVEMLLITRDRAPEQKFVLSRVRQGIETTFSQLWWKFVARVFSPRGEAGGIRSN
jgi:hypothetical protein